METEQILNRILIGCRTTKPKVITAANQYKGKYHKQPIRIQSKKEQTTESAGKREWPSRGWFYFTFDWLKVWWEFSAPITGRMKSKTNAFADKVAQFFFTFCFCYWHVFKLLHSDFELRLSSRSFCVYIDVSDQTTTATTAAGRTNLLVYSHRQRDWFARILCTIVSLASWKRKKKKKRSTFMLAHRNLTMLWFDNTRHSNQGWKKQQQKKNTFTFHPS